MVSTINEVFAADIKIADIIGKNNIKAIAQYLKEKRDVSKQDENVKDGNALFITELINTYLNLKNDSNYVPSHLKHNYKDFIISQIVAKSKDEVTTFCKNELRGCKPIRFIGANKDDNGGRQQNNCITYLLDKTILDKPRGIAQINEISMKTLFLQYNLSLNILIFTFTTKLRRRL